MIAAEEEFYKNHLQNIWINILSNMKIVSNILLILLVCDDKGKVRGREL